MGLQHHNINLFSDYGSLETDHLPSYTHHTLEKLFDEVFPILSETLSIGQQIRDKDFSPYNQNYQKKLKDEIAIGPRRKLHAVIQKFLSQAQENQKNIDDRIKSYSVPKKSDDPIQTIREQFQFQEIRGLVRHLSLQEKKEWIENSIERKDPVVLQAISSSPDKLLPTNLLNEYQRKLAFQLNPELENYEQQTINLAKITREYSAKINSIQQVILLKQKIDDPVSKQEHFQTFPPTDPHTQEMAQILINRERYQKSLESSKEKFNDDNPGLSL